MIARSRWMTSKEDTPGHSIVASHLRRGHSNGKGGVLRSEIEVDDRPPMVARRRGSDACLRNTAWFVHRSGAEPGFGSQQGHHVYRGRTETSGGADLQG